MLMTLSGTFGYLLPSNGHFTNLKQSYRQHCIYPTDISQKRPKHTYQRLSRPLFISKVKVTVSPSTWVWRCGVCVNVWRCGMGVGGEWGVGCAGVWVRECSVWCG